MDQQAPSERARVKRYNWLAHYDRATIEAVLDAMPMCFVGYSIEGRPYVTPTMQWRVGDRVYWHGSSASRMLRAVEGSEVCMAVSLIDGFVLARSAYNFNLNHRSVMIFGKARKVADAKEKEERLREMVDRFVPGQWARLRPILPQELKATTLMWMPIDEASAKVRTGAPEDEAADYDFPVWAGHIPITYEIGEPVADPRNLTEVEMPAEVLDFRIG